MNKKHSAAHAARSTNHQNSPSLWQYLIPPVLIPAMTFICYYASLSYNFQFDDVASINKFFSNRTNNFWNLVFQHPRWMSYWINSVHQSLYQFSPFGYRVFNVSLHSLTSVLIFFFLFRALSQIKKQPFFSRNSFWLALSTALLFGLHPVQTQTVTYVIQGELEGLACFFAVSCSLLFLLSQQVKNSVAKIVCTTLLFAFGALGCGSKEIFIVTPILLVLVDWFLIAQGDWKSFKSRLKIHIPFACMVAGIYVMFFGIRHFSRLLTLQHTAINNIGNVLTENPQERIRPWPFFISQFKVVLHYITMFIWPFNMCVEYDWKISRGIFAADCIGPFIVLALIFGFLLSLYRKNRSHVVVFAALWFFTVLAPRSSFIPSSELLTDYKTFVGSMGILFIFSTVIVYCIERLKEAFLQKELEQFAPLVILPCLLIVMLPVGYAAYSRNLVWSSGVEFWGNILKNAPGKPRAYNNYGVALSESGKYKESIPYYLKAIQMDNHYPDPVNNIAVAYAQTGNVDRGIFYLQKVIEMQPNYPEGYNNLASFLIQKGEYDRAEQSLKVAVKLRPHYGKAYYNLGKVYFAQNRMEEAYESFKNACTIADLDNPAGFETFGRICIALKKYDEAIQALTKMARMAPCRDSYFHLGNAFHIQGDFNKALQAYKQAERYDANDNRLMYNLGETYAKLHDPKMALNYFQRAQSLNYAGANLPIRVAWCLKTLNRLDEAQMLLEQITQQPQMPDDIKRVAQNELKMMREVTV